LTTFSFTVKDRGPDHNESVATHTASITVTPVNDGPTTTVPIAVQEVNPAGAVTFSAANGNLMSVSDVDAGIGQFKVTLMATPGTITLNGVAGLTFDPGQGDGTGDATMTFSGTLANINNALNGMTFNRASEYYGLAGVTVTANDQGNTGGPPLQSAPGVAPISVESYNMWFHGFGPEAGRHVITNGLAKGCTQDYKVFWEHVYSSNTRSYYNGTAWKPPPGLGIVV